MMKSTRPWTPEEVKACIVSTDLVVTSSEIDRTLPAVYTMRNSYKHYLLKDATYMSPIVRALFDQMENIPISDSRQNYNRAKHMVNEAEKMAEGVTGERSRDPEVELEAMTKNFAKEVVRLARQIAKDKTAAEVALIIQKIQKRFEY